MKKKILWKALNGREFIIDTELLGLKTMEDVYKVIDGLRKEHNTGEPTFMTAVGDIPKKDTIDINSLPADLQEKAKEAMKEAWEQPDPKKMN